MATECIFNQHVQGNVSVACTVAHEQSNSELSSMTHIDTQCFARMPQVGEYILSKCRGMAFRVLRHQSAKACGQRLTVIFVDDPTPVSETNEFGDKGMPVKVHNSKCTSHCIDIYYLTIPKGYRINAELL